MDMSREKQSDADPLAGLAERSAGGVLTSELFSAQNNPSNLAALVDSSPAGIIAIDAKGLVTHFNRRAQEIMKYAAEEVLGTPVSRLYEDLRLATI